MIFLDKTQALEKYKLIKHNVMLEDAHLISIQAKRENGFEDTTNEITNSLGIECGLIEESKDGTSVQGRVRVKVASRNEQNEKVAFYTIEIDGKFTKSDAKVSSEEFYGSVDTLLVPMLLPYARAALSNISGLFNAPNIYLPSLDILQSMMKNQRKVSKTKI